MGVLKGMLKRVSCDLLCVESVIIFFIFAATEIQNIQIGDGDIPHNIEIPIYMVFPRLFTCPTLITPNFKIGEHAHHVNFIYNKVYLFSEFEINIVIVFQDDHLVTNNFPIVLTRN